MAATQTESTSEELTDDARDERPEDVIIRRARRYQDAFPDTDLNVVAGHLAVVGTGNAMARSVTKHLEQYGINPARYSLLRAIYFAPDRILPQSQIAREMGTSQPNVTQLLHSLEKEGLVERVIQPENRRVTLARLLPQGVALCDRIVPAMMDFMHQTMADLPSDERAELFRLLAKVRSTLADLEVQQES